MYASVFMSAVGLYVRVRILERDNKPFEVKVDSGVPCLQDGPKTPEEVGCLVGEEEYKRL